VEVFVGASIGIAFDTARPVDALTLVRNADLAMYQAKKNGKGCHEVFDPARHTTGARRLDLEAELRRALARDEFMLHYQPVVDLANCDVIGVEALVRWQHPDRGLVMPAQFVPLAEETGLILPLGRWVLQEACRQAAAWSASRGSPLTVSVNLSARQLRVDLPDLVAVTLAGTGLDPTLLMLEVTESLQLFDTDATADCLRRLAAMGVRIAIDDFGTGYSSLTHLHRFPVSVLKIDQSFVREFPADPRAVAVVRGIVQLGRTLNLATVAEGVEATDQRNRLLDAGCQYGQGYLFAKPVDPTEIEALLRAP
jgi:EAL domain-containing protein (putative c-di-GMP-specific phosphodiesterase class I)